MDAASPPDPRLIDLLEQGIAAARAGDAAAARQRLLAAIGQKPEDEIPWLWLSWITPDPEEAAWYLRHVLTINPDHRQARERLAHLENGVRPAVAWRCPFCGRSAGEQPSRCPGCRALFSGTEIESWLALPPADRPLVRATAAYLESPVARTGRPLWHWTLGIAHLNLGNFPRALPHLRSAGGLSPGNGAVSGLADKLESWLRREGASAPAISPSLTSPVLTPPHAVSGNGNGHGAAAERPPVVAVQPAEATAGRLILVVDDSPTVRKIVAVTLESQGYRALVAADGMQALAKLDETIPDLVLLDIAMPRIDGYRVCRLIKSNDKTRHVPVVMLSGKGGFFDRIRGRAAGADDHIAKPVDRATLLGAVERWAASTRGQEG